MRPLRITLVMLVFVTVACGSDAPDRSSPVPLSPSLPPVELGGEELGDRLIAAIAVGKGGGGIASGFGAVWVENHRAYSISRVDPLTNRAVAEIPAGEHTCGVVAAEDGIWVPSFDGIRRIDPSTNEVVQTIETYSCAVAIAEGKVWSVGEDQLLRAFDPESGAATEYMKVGPEAYLILGEGDIWVIDRTPELWRVDPTTGELAKRVRLAKEEPTWTDLSIGHGAVWVSLGGVLERRNLRTLEVEESMDLGTQPLWLSSGADSLWVTAANREEVLRLDPETLEIRETLEIGDYAGTFLEAFGDGWVSTLNHNAVYRVSI